MMPLQRFGIPEGNPTSVLDRTEGTTLQCGGIAAAKNTMQLLNTMHEQNQIHCAEVGCIWAGTKHRLRDDTHCPECNGVRFHMGRKC